MSDSTTTLAQLKEQVAIFVRERDWGQFHSPKNLSMDISIEAAELMEKFLWLDSKESYAEVDTNRQEIEDEFADVLLGLLALANVASIDIVTAFERKLVEIAKKYPVDKAKGNRSKYTQL